jgi:hypothetical protein
MVASGDDDNKWITADLLQRAQNARVITSDDAELVRKADLEGKGVVAAGKELDLPKATASTKESSTNEMRPTSKGTKPRRGSSDYSTRERA